MQIHPLADRIWTSPAPKSFALKRDHRCGLVRVVPSASEEALLLLPGALAHANGLKVFRVKHLRLRSIEAG
jgi:hypothetical protein